MAVGVVLLFAAAFVLTGDDDLPTKANTAGAPTPTGTVIIKVRESIGVGAGLAD